MARSSGEKVLYARPGFFHRRRFYRRNDFIRMKGAGLGHAPTVHRPDF
jgi:hypothetical protein